MRRHFFLGRVLPRAAQKYRITMAGHKRQPKLPLPSRKKAKSTTMTAAFTWRRSVAVALVLAGALAAAGVMGVATLVVRHHFYRDTPTRPVPANRTDETGGGTPDQDDDGHGHKDDDPKGPTGDGNDGGCASITRARRCTSRCNCVWCPPGVGFGCHDFVAGARPCGARDGRRRALWACGTHLMTWLSVGGAGLVCAFFVGLAVVVWCLWPRLCRHSRDRHAAVTDAHTSPASPSIKHQAINRP